MDLIYDYDENKDTRNDLLSVSKFLVNFRMNKSLSILRYEVMLRVNVQVSLLRHHYTCGGASQTKIHIHIC